MSDRKAVSTSRRGFLKALTVAGGATAVSAALPVAASATPPQAARTGTEEPQGYRETAHVRAYYESARI